MKTLNTRTALYWIYDADSVLLYVGIGLNPFTRWVDHQSKAWWSTVARIEVDWFDARAAAESAELAAIRTMHPRYNIRDVVRPPSVVAVASGRGDLGPADVAALFEVSPTTVRRWTERGWLAASRLPGSRHRRYTTDDVATFRQRYEAGEFASQAEALASD